MQPMEPDQDVTLTFINDESPDLTILKVDKQTGAPLAGAMFTVEKLEEPEKGFVTGSPFTTDAEIKSFCRIWHQAVIVS